MGARAPAAPPVVELIVRGGTLVDGSGSAPRAADVAIDNGRVHSVGDLGKLAAVREIDATGLVVAPGFIDMHSHADLIVLADGATQDRLLRAKIVQGVTTAIVGNCGLGVAPSTSSSAPMLADVNGWMTPQGVEAGALSVGAYLDVLGSNGVALNVGTLVPHGRLAQLGWLETWHGGASERSRARRI